MSMTEAAEKVATEKKPSVGETWASRLYANRDRISNTARRLMEHTNCLVGSVPEAAGHGTDRIEPSNLYEKMETAFAELEGTINWLEAETSRLEEVMLV